MEGVLPRYAPDIAALIYNAVDEPLGGLPIQTPAVEFLQAESEKSREVDALLQRVFELNDAFKRSAVPSLPRLDDDVSRSPDDASIDSDDRARWTKEKLQHVLEQRLLHTTFHSVFAGRKTSRPAQRTSDAESESDNSLPKRTVGADAYAPVRRLWTSLLSRRESLPKAATVLLQEQSNLLSSEGVQLEEKLRNAHDGVAADVLPIVIKILRPLARLSQTAGATRAVVQERVSVQLPLIRRALSGLLERYQQCVSVARSITESANSADVVAPHRSSRVFSAYAVKVETKYGPGEIPLDDDETAQSYDDRGAEIGTLLNPSAVIEEKARGVMESLYHELKGRERLHRSVLALFRDCKLQAAASHDAARRALDACATTTEATIALLDSTIQQSRHPRGAEGVAAVRGVLEDDAANAATALRALLTQGHRRLDASRSTQRRSWGRILTELQALSRERRRYEQVLETHLHNEAQFYHLTRLRRDVHAALSFWDAEMKTLRQRHDAECELFGRTSAFARGMLQACRSHQHRWYDSEVACVLPLLPPLRANADHAERAVEDLFSLLRRRLDVLSEREATSWQAGTLLQASHRQTEECVRQIRWEARVANAMWSQVADVYDESLTPLPPRGSMPSSAENRRFADGDDATNETRSARALLTQLDASHFSLRPPLFQPPKDDSENKRLVGLVEAVALPMAAVAVNNSQPSGNAAENSALPPISRKRAFVEPPSLSIQAGAASTPDETWRTEGAPEGVPF